MKTREEHAHAHEHEHAHAHAHAHGHAHGHLHMHPHGPWQRGHWPRRYVRARGLQRQLFLSFGGAILLTLVMTSAVFFFSHVGPGERPFLRPLGLVASAALVWMISGVVARRIARPLRELSRVAQQLGEGKLDSRIDLPSRGAAEVRELASSFNDMASRIEQQVKTQRDLLGAVSHELRTPLARMRLLLAIAQERELARLQPHKAADPGTCKAAVDSLAQMEREIVEMDALVGGLLAGARVDAGMLERRALDVGALVAGALERSRAMEAAAADAALELSSVVEPGLSLEADATLLARALAILIDNARKHGGKNAALRVARSAGSVRFALEDDGPGFAPDDLAHVFEPFRRGEGKREDAHGVGLGLYLLKRIAEAHGGKVFAENRASGGARVGFVLPA